MWATLFSRLSYLGDLSLCGLPYLVRPSYLGTLAYVGYPSVDPVIWVTLAYVGYPV